MVSIPDEMYDRLQAVKDLLANNGYSNMTINIFRLSSPSAYMQMPDEEVLQYASQVEAYSPLDQWTACVNAYNYDYDVRQIVGAISNGEYTLLNEVVFYVGDASAKDDETEIGDALFRIMGVRENKGYVDASIKGSAFTLTDYDCGLMAKNDMFYFVNRRYGENKVLFSVDTPHINDWRD